MYDNLCKITTPLVDNAGPDKVATGQPPKTVTPIKLVSIRPYIADNLSEVFR